MIKVKTYPRELPRALYHGTLTKYLDSIKQKGLLIGTKERAAHPGFEEDVIGCISLTDSEKTARFFAMATAVDQTPEDEPIDVMVLIIDSLKAKIYGAPIFEVPEKLADSAFEGTEYRTCRNIPPEAIIGYIRIYKNKKGKLITEKVSL